MDRIWFFFVWIFVVVLSLSHHVIDRCKVLLSCQKIIKTSDVTVILQKYVPMIKNIEKYGVINLNHFRHKYAQICAFSSAFCLFRRKKTWNLTVKMKSFAIEITRKIWANWIRTQYVVHWTNAGWLNLTNKSEKQRNRRKYCRRIANVLEK